jgi:thiamine-phosphate pyrophosphorylase
VDAVASPKERLSRASLYLILTPQRCAHAIEKTVEEAIEGGVDLVQLRDKEASDVAFVRLALRVGAICRERGVPFIVNDRAALAGDARADGVHVGEHDVPPEFLRERLGAEPIVGLSTHSREEVLAAAARGVDYVGLGPIYATETKSLARTPRGPRLVSEACGATRLPVFPIGGIDARNASVLVACGARRLAVSGAICAAPDPREAARALRRVLAPPAPDLDAAAEIRPTA